MAPATLPMEYPLGAVKLTYSRHFPKQDSLDFKSIVRPGDLRTGVFTAMCIDPHWLSAEIPGSAKIYLLSGQDGLGSFERENWVLAVKKMPQALQYGVMHAKLMLLYFDSFVRVAISSGNLLSFDYDTVENVVFVQDFPMSATFVESQFQRELSCIAESILPHFINSQAVVWSGYDWSAASVRLVYSKPSRGCPSPVPAKSDGYRWLSSLVSCYASDTIEIQATSYGRLGNDWPETVVRSLSSDPDVAAKFIFPSESYARESFLGAAVGRAVW